MTDPKQKKVTTKPRVLLGSDLSEDEQVDALMEWLAQARGWTPEDLERAKAAEKAKPKN